jgi:hypothetical protein
MLSLDDWFLFLIGSDFSAEILDYYLIRNTQGVSNIFKVINVCLNTIQSTFLFQDHLWHSIPEKIEKKCYLYELSTIVEGMFTLAINKKYLN